ncbi:hypothetical protein GF373_00545 [bacterium]|nr:hypothetical protein [bacterium]
MKILYWNVNRNRDIPKYLSALAMDHEPDIIILSEWEHEISHLLINLNKNLAREYHKTYSPYNDPQILTRIPRDTFKLMRDSKGISVRKIDPIVGPDLLLIAVHLPSKLYRDDEDQLFEAETVHNIVLEEEKRIGHSRSIVIGDFNMNPFEHSMVAASGFHAVMDKKVAEKKSRKVSKKEHFFFYNPMWGLYGENIDGPSGTYYYDSGKQINYYWNMFDQVLIRPDLLDNINQESLKILTKAGKYDLVNESGIPDKEDVSDHFPILLSLHL